MLSPRQTPLPCASGIAASPPSAVFVFRTYSDQTKTPATGTGALALTRESRRQAAEFSAAFIWASSFLAGS